MTRTHRTPEVCPEDKCWIPTASGGKIHLLNPRPEDINPWDIATALSHLCRYNGQVRKFYSVAQHTLLVWTITAPEHHKWALLHDAAEAYLGDVVTPLKASIVGTRFRSAEAWFMAAIRKRFGLVGQEPPEIKRADLVALATEREHVLQYAGPLAYQPPPDIRPVNAALLRTWWPKDPEVVRDRLLRVFAMEGIQ